jgi:hypothetical protein
MYREMGMTYWLEKAAAEMAGLPRYNNRLARHLIRPSPRYRRQT